MRRDSLAPSLLLLAATFAPCCDGVSLNLRTTPVAAPPVHRVLARTSLQASVNSSAVAALSANSSANASLNGTQPFRLHDYPPAIGKVFALYYSSFSGQKVTQIEARDYKALDTTPKDSLVFDPETSMALKRGECNLVLKSHTSVASDTREYNLRLAEVAVCHEFFGEPCGPKATGCEITMFAPLPNNPDDEKYIAAGMALTAHSLLCAQKVENPYQREARCAITRDEAAIAAGLRQSGNGIKLRPIPDEWTGLKLDAVHELRFKQGVFASGNQAAYEESTHNERRQDVLAYSREPPQPVYCEDLACLIGKFEKR